MRVLLLILVLVAVVALTRADMLSVQHYLRSHGFSYKKHGSDWHEGVCASGKAQSPIDISSDQISSEASSHKVALSYKKADGLSLAHNGHALQVDGDLGSIQIDGDKFNVKQFHFHQPSEHQVDGKSFDAEMHIVHQKAGSTGVNDLAVIGIFFRLGKANKFLDQINFVKAPSKKGKKTKIGKAVDLYVITQLTRPKFHYKGSLTTPPCSETVFWMVTKQPAEISHKQLKAMQKLFSKNKKFADGNGNNRQVQDLNERKVSLIEVTNMKTRNNNKNKKKTKKCKEAADKCSNNNQKGHVVVINNQNSLNLAGDDDKSSN